MTLLLPLLAFVFASLIIAALGMRLATNRGSEMDRRLAEVVGGRDQVAEGPAVRRAARPPSSASGRRCRCRRRKSARSACG